MNLEEFKAERVELAKTLSIEELLSKFRFAVEYGVNMEAGSDRWEKAMIEAKALEDEIKNRCSK